VRVLAEDAALAFGVERELDGLARLAVNVEPQALNREGARAVAGRRRILRAREARTDAGADADPARIVDLDRAGALCPMRRQQRPKQSRPRPRRGSRTDHRGISFPGL